MTKAELDYILGAMLDSQKNVSDLNITADKPLQVETSGELVPVRIDPAVERLTPFQTETIAMTIINSNRRLLEELLRNGSCDCSSSIGQKARFRVNSFSHRGHYSVVLRKLSTEIPTLEQLNMPSVFHSIAKEKTGLVLVTGATGSGKSTTLAALLNELNLTKSLHIVTLEDPVAVVHPQRKATFNQRELGNDFATFAAGLRAAEVVSLKVCDIDSRRMIIRVEQGKGHKDRNVMLSPSLLDLLRAWWRAARPPGWLFPGRNPVQPMTTRQLNRACHAAAEAAGIEKNVSLHTLRHSFATHLLEQNVDVRVIQVLLGHAKLDSTALYARVATKTIQQVMSPLEHIALKLKEIRPPT